MTLRVVDAGPGPHTHALVIGIGGYEHLREGTGKPLPNLLDYGKLGQLTSPPRSALAVADALRSPVLDWQVPLGTVDVLISAAPGDPDPAGSGEQFDPATRDGFQRAFDQWWDRCDADRENIGFFYVAGHGVEGLHQIVLASDFGKSPKQPWLNAFDVDKTLRALTANAAQTQVFLVDACREVTTANVQAPDAYAPPLLEPDLRQPDNCKQVLKIRATNRTGKASGEFRRPSFFARAIVAGLAGGAGVRADGEWWITTFGLSDRLPALMESVGADNAQKAECAADRPFRLARLRCAPPAKLQLSCHPDDATRDADLAWWRNGTARRYRPQRAPEPWTVDVNPGLCHVSATFTCGGYEDRSQEVIVMPPLTCERVVVR